MYANRLSREYVLGAKEFIKFAVEHVEDPSRIICPCLTCCFLKRISEKDLMDHLVCDGIDPSYVRWTKRGEPDITSSEQG